MRLIANYITDSFNLNNTGVSNAVDTKDLPRHRWYYYKEGFSPTLVKTAIERYNLHTNNIIIDPFNGSGTVTLTAAENNIPSIGMEVNPFTSFVASTKAKNTHLKKLTELFERTLKRIEASNVSELEKYSTFSELSGKEKWLFNLDVLRAFSGGLKFLEDKKSNAKNILKLALLSSIMKNSNAKKDGKCLRYKTNWQNLNYNKSTFIETFKKEYYLIQEDIKNVKIKINPEIYTIDSRKGINEINKKFDLAITSPPYLNTFDYTDIYRPELLLGRFIKDSYSLYRLRINTVRSHIQAKWNLPNVNGIECILLKDIYQRLNSKKEKLMDSKIPLMILAYFEDMKIVFQQLAMKANKNAHLWIVVANSAYANEEIPVDLVLTDIAAKNGWKLQEIGVLREIRKRKTKYSPDITKLRESIIILEKNNLS